MTDLALVRVAKAAEDLLTEYRAARPGIIVAIKSERKAKSVMSALDLAVVLLEQALADARKENP